MTFKKIGLLGLVLGIGLGTAACTDGYGYSGVSLGYGAGNGYYGDPYNSGYGYDAVGAYGSPYYGWYNDFYYPGTGIYVYDQYRRPFRWNNAQRRYWQQRRSQWRGDRNYQNNWGNFGRNDRQFDGRRQYDRQRYDRQRGDDRNRGYRDRNGDGRPDVYRGRRNNGAGVAPRTDTNRVRVDRSGTSQTTNARSRVRTERVRNGVRGNAGNRGNARGVGRNYGALERPQ